MNLEENSIRKWNHQDDQNADPSDKRTRDARCIEIFRFDQRNKITFFSSDGRRCDGQSGHFVFFSLLNVISS